MADDLYFETYKVSVDRRLSAHYEYDIRLMAFIKYEGIQSINQSFQQFKKTSS
jgi:hypothetical protein